jgi:hypothetical protein
MPLVKVIRDRGANIVVEAHGEVLFAATGDVGRWTNRFSQRVRHFAAQEAPTNKRPRWAHYGKPLKSTMRASTKYRPTLMRVDSAVGSTAPHAYYVDQGTGVYAGNGPYTAKILPPWTQGGSSLYEHTWRPGGGRGRVGRVLIKGQKGQGFLDAGVKQGFRVMRLAQSAYPDTAKITDALSSLPVGLEDFLGNTPVTPAFVAQLNEWRQWRDTAWQAERERQSQAADARYRAKKAAQAATRDQILAEIAQQQKAENVAAYKASAAAAKRRAAAQKAALKAQRDRAAEAKRRKEEQDARAREAARLQRGNRKMRADAMAFYNRIRAAYPDATFASAKLADGVIVYRITYVVNGETVRQDFAYGYST